MIVDVLGQGLKLKVLHNYFFYASGHILQFNVS